MLYLSYTYFVHDTQHLRSIRKAITGQLKTHPVYVFQIGDKAQLQFEANEDAYLIDQTITEALSEYEFITDLSAGNEEIVLSITRLQSPGSGDDWGRRWNEDTLITEKHLVKKRERFSPPFPRSTFWAFFEDEVMEYEVHLGLVGKGTPGEGYVVVDGPITDNAQRNILSETFPDARDAFWAGQRLLEPQIEAAFAAHRSSHKRKSVKKARNAPH